MNRNHSGLPRVTVSPWAALAAGWIVYSADGRTLLLLALPVMIHELGHWLSLRLLGCRVCAIRWELSGLCLRYHGLPGRWGQVIAALSGPAAGLLYARIAVRFGTAGELSSGISLLLSVFNLIPALPLDGGRAAEALLDRESAKCLSLVCSVLCAVSGLFLFARGKGAALALAGLILLVWQIPQFSSSARSPD